MSTLGAMFSNNPKLTNVRRFFEATGVTGQIPSGTSVAASALFTNNPLLQNANYLFRSASSITGSFPVNLFGNCANLTTARGVFRACTGITGTIPGAEAVDSSLYMFKCLTSDNNAFNSLTDVSELFYGCSNMSSNIPSTLFAYTPVVNNVSSVFRGCGSLTAESKGVTGNIPANLLSTMNNLTNVSYLFSGCWNLTPMTWNAVKYSTPVDDNGSSTLFANNKLITNAAGLFQSTKVYNIPSDLFTGITLLENVSYMFNQANRSEANIPAVIFNYCPNISNIECFAGESGNNYVTTYSFTEFPSGIFKEYSASAGTGQKYISNVFCAFRNNNNTNGGTAILFQDWTNPPTKFAGCYHMCSNLTNIASVDDDYKQTA